MQKKIGSLAIIAVVIALCIGASSVAAPGAVDEPVLTKSYVDNYMDNLAKKAMDKLFAHFQGRVDSVIPHVATDTNENKVETVTSEMAREISQHLNLFTNKPLKLKLKMGDALYGGTGTEFNILGGYAAVSGTLIDMTTGLDLTKRARAPQKTKMMSINSDNPLSGLIATSEVTVLVSGYYRPVIAPAPKYNVIGDGLKLLGVVSGTNAGYDLQRPATRDESIVLLTRLLGEGAAAESYTGTSPFKDLTWGANFVNYAYSKNYTSGTSATTFSPSNTTTAEMFCTYVLKALHYNSDTDFVWTNSLDFAQSVGVFTPAEVAGFKKSFLRDEMYYMSYYALFAKLKGTETTLLEHLVSIGALSASKVVETVDTIQLVRP